MGSKDRAKLLRERFQAIQKVPYVKKEGKGRPAKVSYWKGPEDWGKPLPVHFGAALVHRIPVLARMPDPAPDPSPRPKRTAKPSPLLNIATQYPYRVT
jgi:hypothetical protein